MLISNRLKNSREKSCQRKSDFLEFLTFTVSLFAKVSAYNFLGDYFALFFNRLKHSNKFFILRCTLPISHLKK
jgi:hypothetical protein